MGYRQFAPCRGLLSSLLTSCRLAMFGLLLSGATAQAGAPTVLEAGPGGADPTTRQLARTKSDVLYVVGPDCAGNYPICGPNRLHMYHGDRAGLASGWIEADAAHAPSAGADGTSFIGASAAAIDGDDVIHVAWIDREGPGHVYATTFDTRTDRWAAAPILLQETNWNDFVQGDQGVGIAVDAAGKPHAVWCGRGTATSGPIRIWYANRTGAVWTAPVLADTQAVPTGSRWSLHPAIAFTAAGDLLIAWLQGSESKNLGDVDHYGFGFQPYTPDGIIYSRLRLATGGFGPTTRIPDLAMTTIDNGPSLYISPDGTKHIAFVSGRPRHEDEIRYWYDAGTGWRGDQQIPTRIVTHDPTLGPDGVGGIYIYTHSAPDPNDAVPFNYIGVGGDETYIHKPRGGIWEPQKIYYHRDGVSYDSAVSARWSQFFYHFPNELDMVFWQADNFTLLVGQATPLLP